MIGIYYENTWLDLFEDTELQLEFNSTLYLGDEVNAMQGSFTYPFSLPLSATNQRLFKYPHRYDNPATFLKNGLCEVHFEGHFLFKAFLSIQSTEEDKVNIEIVFNPFQGIKDEPLNQLDFGLFEFETDPRDAQGQMTRTCTQPTAHPFIATPVLNTGYNDDSALEKTSTWQNYFDIVGQYNSTPGAYFKQGSIVTPFLRISYILEKICKNAGFQIIENAFDDLELAQLCLYTQYDIKEDGSLPSSLNLNKLASSTKLRNWLVKILRRFNAGMVWDFKFEKIKIVLLGNILKSDYVVDYTSSVSYKYKKTRNEKKISRLANRERIEVLPANIYYLQPVADFNAVKTGIGEFFKLPNGQIFQKAVSSISILGLPIPLFFYLNIYPTDEKKLEKEGTEYTSDVQVLDTCYIDESNGYTVKQEVLVVKYAKDKELTDDILIAFRGTKGVQNAIIPVSNTDLQQIDGSVVRIGNDNTFPGSSSVPAKYSHYWHRASGLYDSFWKKELEMIGASKKIETQLLLTLSDIFKFDFSKKIMLHHQIYLATRLKVKLSHKGLSPCEVELISL